MNFSIKIESPIMIFPNKRGKPLYTKVVWMRYTDDPSASYFLIIAHTNKENLYKECNKCDLFFFRDMSYIIKKNIKIQLGMRLSNYSFNRLKQECKNVIFKSTLLK